MILVEGFSEYIYLYRHTDLHKINSVQCLECAHIYLGDIFTHFFFLNYVSKIMPY